MKDLDEAFESVETRRGDVMHSHDKTMLANLGFADPDKKNPQHDLACMYLTQKDVRKKLCDWTVDSFLRPTQPAAEVLSARTGGKVEQHLQKGEGKYATTVGFIDVKLCYKLVVDKLVGWGATEKDFEWSVFAEVKIARVPIGDVLRQLNLYKSYFDYRVDPEGYGILSGGRPHWAPYGILVAPWDLTTPELKSIESNGFAFLKLGKGFTEWQAAIESPKAATEI